MKQGSKRFLSLLISLLFILGTFVVYAGFIRAANDSVQGLRATLAGKENFLSDQQAIMKNVQEFISSYKGEGQLQDLVSSVLPLKPDAAGALAQVQSLLQANGLTATSISFSAPSVQATSNKLGVVRPIGKLQVQVQAAGTYESMKRFLAGLENNLRIFELQNMTVSPVLGAQGRATSNNFTYNFTVATYYQNP